MENVRQWEFSAWGLGMVLHFFLLTTIGRGHHHVQYLRSQELSSSSSLHLRITDHQVVMGNDRLNVTFSRPAGMVTKIGIHNLLSTTDNQDRRGYWDIDWHKPGVEGRIDSLRGTKFKVIVENEDQIEISFTKTWNVGAPLNVDKRFIMLRGSSGFYSYAIFERLKGWPDINIDQARIVFKLHESKFDYMAMSDKRQGIMPRAIDRARGERLAYPEAVLLTNPTNSLLTGQVDDKYQYSCDNKDNGVHGWISLNSLVGFWMITPSNEFRNGGPLKQDLTSHVGPTTLSMFVSTHYAGVNLRMEFRNGKAWKKVFGPVFIYLNSINSATQKPQALWEDAKAQMIKETAKWPYNFPSSNDFPGAEQRGTVRGQLLVNDRYISKRIMPGAFAYVGLAALGVVGSWQSESKGYQFWSQANSRGVFLIKAVRTGTYNLYAWVPGIIGDYIYDFEVTITPGCDIELDDLVFYPPRNGPTLWEIGIPDRTAAEFYVPYPNPQLLNPRVQNFRQYGLWNRYTVLYPSNDLIYTVGVSNYTKDWFFAHVTRNLGSNTYCATTWKILFELEEVDKLANYTLPVALASANHADLQVGVNDPEKEPPHFKARNIGKDNAIARHGIHGLYHLYSVGISGSLLSKGWNSIFLTQSQASSPFAGLVYDYIRLECPPTT